MKSISKAAALAAALALSGGLARAETNDAGPGPGMGPGGGQGMGPGSGQGMGPGGGQGMGPGGRAGMGPGDGSMMGPGRGAGMRAGGGPMHFDPKSVTTVSGEITAVNKVEGRRNEGTHLEVKTAEGSMRIWLGPSWYLDRQTVKLAKGDKVEVTGSKVQRAKGSALIAQTVKKGDATLTLRDANGVPAWSRGRR